MGYSKVIYGGKTIIDLTNDDVKAEYLLKDYKAHDANGDPIVGACDYDIKSEGLTATADEILGTKTAAVGKEVITGKMPNNGSFTDSIIDANTPKSIPKGYHDGGGSIGIADVEKAKLIPENIRAEITILGVTGTMSGSEDSNPQSKEVDSPLTDDLTVLPDTDKGYNCLSQVTVKKVKYVEIDNTASGKGVTVQIG